MGTRASPAIVSPTSTLLRCKWMQNWDVYCRLDCRRFLRNPNVTKMLKRNGFISELKKVNTGFCEIWEIFFQRDCYVFCLLKIILRFWKLHGFAHCVTVVLHKIFWVNQVILCRKLDECCVKGKLCILLDQTFNESLFHSYVA